MRYKVGDKLSRKYCKVEGIKILFPHEDSPHRKAITKFFTIVGIEDNRFYVFKSGFKKLIGLVDSQPYSKVN